jgi:hypothetical protein
MLSVSLHGKNRQFAVRTRRPTRNVVFPRRRLLAMCGCRWLGRRDGVAHRGDGEGSGIGGAAVSAAAAAAAAEAAADGEADAERHVSNMTLNLLLSSRIQTVVNPFMFGVRVLSQLEVSCLMIF